MKILSQEDDALCKLQVSNLPDINVLDLGAWATIQAQVEERQRKLVMRNDVLANSVEHAFYEMLDPSKLLNIYNHWCKVLQLLNSCGGNELMETCRGKQNVRNVSELNLDISNNEEVLVNEQRDTESINNFSGGSDIDTESEDEYDVLDLMSLNSHDSSQASVSTSEETLTVATVVMDDYDDESTVTEHTEENRLDMELMDATNGNSIVDFYHDEFLDNDMYIILDAELDCDSISIMSDVSMDIGG